MDTNILPNSLKKFLSNMDHEFVMIGCTKDIVIRFFNNNGIYYLKTGVINTEAIREHEMLIWLNGKLPVPDVLDWVEIEDRFYLLTSSANGTMACNEHGLAKDDEFTAIKALADGLKQFQEIDISTCQLESKLDNKFKAALFNIENNLVDMEDFINNGRFDTPFELYDYLLLNRPDEDLCLTHGDFCLPNIFITGDKATGFVDMGRGGIADRYQDIALCYRSLKYNTKNQVDKNLLFECLEMKPDWEKIDFYILLDELF